MREIKKEIKVLTTFTGKTIDPFNVKIKDIDPLDIATASSNLCRYFGHVSSFYSVAQHCCLMCDKAPTEIKKQVLLHDAAEAYVGDIITPLKHALAFEFYRDVEEAVMRRICERFDLPEEFDPRVKQLDLAIREAEFRDLKQGHKPRKNRMAGDTFDTIMSWTPKRSKKEYIKRLRRVGVDI